MEEIDARLRRLAIDSLPENRPDTQAAPVLTAKRWRKQERLERTYGDQFMETSDYYIRLKGLVTLMRDGGQGVEFRTKRTEAQFCLPQPLCRWNGRTCGTAFPPTFAPNSGKFWAILGELLIYLTIHERLFDNPFWYLDGKENTDDPQFTRNLNHLFERFYESNPRFAVIWRSQTQRLANSADKFSAPNPTFGRLNCNRQEAALPGLADDLLASEPFRWLLPTASDKVVTSRREELIHVFRAALRVMITCETCAHGQPVLRGIPELGPIFRGPTAILVAPRPGLAYVDGVVRHRPGIWDSTTIEVIHAQVLPERLLDEAPGEVKDKKMGQDEKEVVDEDDEDEEEEE
ncbi:hypothetical protein BJX70DRAFT_402416 [Aspergillus crustosus]